jgi:hypothetical protein
MVGSLFGDSGALTTPAGEHYSASIVVADDEHWDRNWPDRDVRRGQHAARNRYALRPMTRCVS